MFDGLGTYDPRPEGTLHALGHREDPDTLVRLVSQCYQHVLACGSEAEAHHVSKRLHEQLTGSIDHRACGSARAPAMEGPAWARRHQDWWLRDRVGRVLEVGGG